mgnify:CR=1 FL=1
MRIIIGLKHVDFVTYHKLCYWLQSHANKWIIKNNLQEIIKDQGKIEQLVSYFKERDDAYILNSYWDQISAYLKKYGFEMYDEIFDYEFDKKESLEERIDGIMKNLLKIKDEDYSNIYKKLKEKIEKNTLTGIEIIKQR